MVLCGASLNGFVVVIALLVFVVSFCEAASVSERFACVLSFPNAY